MAQLPKGGCAILFLYCLLHLHFCRFFFLTAPGNEDAIEEKDESDDHGGDDQRQLLTVAGGFTPQAI